MTAEQVLENETAGISCYHRFKYWGWEYLPYRGEVKAEKHETSPSCSISLDCWRESIPPAAKHRIKPGPFGASDLTG